MMATAYPSDDEERLNHINDDFTRGRGRSRDFGRYRSRSRGRGRGQGQGHGRGRGTFTGHNTSSAKNDFQHTRTTYGNSQHGRDRSDEWRRGRGASRSRPQSYHATRADSRGRGLYRGGSSESIHYSTSNEHRRDGTVSFQRKNRLTLKKVIDLSKCSDDPDEILLEISDETSGFQEVFDNEMKADWVFYILKILTQAVTSSLKRNLINLLLKIEVNLEPRLSEVLGEICVRSPVYHHIWGNRPTLCATCCMILKIVQVLANAIKSATGKCKSLLAQIKEVKEAFGMEDKQLSKEIQSALEIIAASVDESERFHRSKQRQRSKNNGTGDDPDSPEDFREISILPIVQDIQIDENPFLRRNLTEGNYDSLEQYLDIHFRLLREDFVQPLRNGIQEYIASLRDLKKRRNIREIKLYENVQIIRPVCSDNGLNHVIQFDTFGLKDIDWAVSRRLLYGSLLCLSNDDFKTISFAVVTDRQVTGLKHGRLQVHFETRPLISGSTRFVMAESTSYFEAFRHVLEGLQTVGDILPFQRYILDCNTTIKPPSYLLEKGVPVYDFTCILPDKSKIGCFTEVPALTTTRWPTASDLGLDVSQYEALQLALTKEMAIIQGPPGTGKTFIGLQIAKMLLKNKSYWKDNKKGCPILVICYTNHALDQFLEGILKFCKGSIVRIGGRCKSDALEPYTLHKIKINTTKSKSERRAFYIHKKSMRLAKNLCESEVRRLSARLESTFIEPQGFNTLRDHMTTVQVVSFMCRKTSTGNLITDWLSIQPETIPKDETVTENEGAKRLWVVHILDNINDILHGRENITDICAINLLERAKLYKGWLAELETEKKSNSTISKEEKNALGKLLQRSKEKIIYPKEMLRYTKSECTVRQLEALRNTHDFEEWLAINGSDDSTSTIAYIYHVAIDDDHECDNEESVFEERELEPDDDGYAIDSDDNMENSEFKRKETIRADWLRQWNTKREFEKTKVMTTDVRDLSNEEASRMKNVWSLSKADRHSLYWHWVNKLRESLTEEAGQSEQRYKQANESLIELKDLETKNILRRRDVIGMTTTGAAKNSNLLQSIQPAIIIVEEAAEVLESHIVTALNTECKHLILIGDHKQLRPSTTVYKLAKDYHLDISLFERMIMNGIPRVTLSEQHRMRREISVLLRNQYLYPDLRDHQSVSEYSHVLGIDADVYFINHSEKAKRIPSSTSFHNPHEAEFIACLCKYLLQQGYTGDQITVLTPYMGQVTYIRNIMPKRDFPGVYITAVDNYQGEENEIILLSLVRSDTILKTYNQIGFLAINNRVCVALSRAKRGFYVIGNFTLMKAHSRLWNHNVCLLAESGKVGPELTLRCQNHPDHTIHASKPTDFEKAPEGGCTEPCLAILKCNHTCPIKICHIIDHEQIQCLEPCENKFSECGHKCKKKCYEECGDCLTKVKKELPQCGHKTSMHCYRDPRTWKCQIRCDVELKCGHKCMRDCGDCSEQNSHEDRCKIKVSKERACGHKVSIPCHVDVTLVECPAPCEVQLICEHKCNRKCGYCSKSNSHETKCKKIVKAKLKCGHSAKLPCCKSSEEISQEVQCKVKVLKVLACGHKVSKPCYLDVTSIACSGNCEIQLPCGHSCKRKCIDCLKSNSHEKECKAMVEKQLSCGHSVQMECYKDLSFVNCSTTYVIALSCGHSKKLNCSQNTLTTVCKEPCATMLVCGHKCSGTCDTCLRGNIHQQCEQICRKLLPCGHRCKYKCSDRCPPCKLSCEWTCSHGTKCRQKCSEKCKPCMKKCEYKCAHMECTKLCHEDCDKGTCDELCTKVLKCGHRCIGLCGETCVCTEFCSEKKSKIYPRHDKEKVYIKLSKCKCILPKSMLDKHMSESSFAKTKIVNRCPACRTIISSCDRYANTLNQDRKDALKEMMSKNVSEKEKANILRALKTQVLRLKDSGLDDSDLAILKTRLKVSTCDTIHALEETITLLEQLLRVTMGLNPSIQEKLVVKPHQIKLILMKERKCGSSQLWDEIRSEIKRIGNLIQMTNITQEHEGRVTAGDVKKLVSKSMAMLTEDKPFTVQRQRVTEQVIDAVTKHKAEV